VSGGLSLLYSLAFFRLSRGLRLLFAISHSGILLAILGLCNFSLFTFVFLIFIFTLVEHATSRFCGSLLFLLFFG